MKKILSIVVGILLGVVGVYAQKTYKSTMTLNVKAATDFEPTSSGVNVTTLVCSSAVSEDCNTQLSFSKIVEATVPAFSGLKEFGTWIAAFYLIDIPQTFTFYLSTQIASEHSGEYVFSHWTDPDGNVIEGLGKQGVYTYNWMAKNSDLFGQKSLLSTELRAKNPSKSITMRAHWVQPQVTNSAVTNCGEVTDPNVRPTNGTIEFTLNRDVEANNYIANTENLKENNFQVRNSAYSKGKYKYTISYDPTGIHGTYQATMSLCSKYPTANIENKCQTAEIKVMENYKPVFTANDSYGFGDVSKGSFRQTPVGYLSLTKTNYAANNAQWTAELIPDENSAGLFVFQEDDYSTTGEPIVRFVPGAMTADGDYSATLRLKATYYDALSKPIESEVKDIALTAHVYTAEESKIQFGSPKIEEINFGDIILGESPVQRVSVVLDKVLINAESPTFKWTDNDIFTYDYEDGNLIVGVDPLGNCGMGYNAVLKATAISSSNGENVSASIYVKANLKMATPVLEAYGGIGKNTLFWDAIVGAQEYKIYRDGVEIDITTETTYIDAPSEGGSEYEYQIEAVYTSDPNFNTKSNKIKVTIGFPQVITDVNASSTGIRTGTDHPTNTTFPYKPAYEVDLARCFDVNSGVALFDTLYVFGLTTNSEGGADGINAPSGSVGCNAKTLCYVFARTSNTEYTYAREFDATKQRYDWGTKQNNKHIYFNGYCPFAYMGGNATDVTAEGWMYFTGGNTSVDIYLDSCQIMGRYKTPIGKNGGYEEYVLTLEASLENVFNYKENTSIIKGVSAPFVFSSTTKNAGESYKPSVHIAGRNHLKGQLGAYIKRTVGDVAGIKQVDANIGNIYTYSSPITIKPTDVGQYTDLVMDDIWSDGTITNGYIRLDSERGDSHSEKVVAIDLGSEYGSLTINGGQYHLRNAAADGTYACNLAIGYRKFIKEITYQNIPCRLGLYGFGGDMTDCKVTINSGTFTMHANMYPDGHGGWLGTGYYEDRVGFLDLRLPAGKNGTSRINGGTFNGMSHVFMCSNVISTGTNPKNAQDWWLCLQDVQVDPEQLTTSGSVKFIIPEPFDDEEIYSTDKVSYNLINDGDAVANANLYGGQSVNPFIKEDGNSYVRLLLVGDACGEECGCTEQPEKIYHQWATAIPEFNATQVINGTTYEVSIGGVTSVEIEDNGTAILHPTTQLLYADLDGMNNNSLVLDNGAGIKLMDINNNRGCFDNEDSYTIYEHLNILKMIQADTWYTFTAPFDVHDVSVIETNENAITAAISKVSEDKKRSTALALQATQNLELFYTLQNFVLPNSDGRASSLTLKDLLKPSDSHKNIARQPLTHYNGDNMMEANYYLYELKKDTFDADGAGEQLNIEWEPVVTTKDGVIMKQDKVYAMQFPWCPMCNDLDSRTYYDYWSNKMILFHGNGSQTIRGTNDQPYIIPSTLEAGYATLVGNSTFADMTLAAEAGYVHNTEKDYFELNGSAYTVKPTEGFLLYNSGSSKMPARISRAGQMEYSENDATSLDGVPTIGDRTTLMLLGAMDGFEVLSLGEQLVTVYNLQGNIVFQKYMAEGEQVYVASGVGIFIVRGENESIKIMVD